MMMMVMRMKDDGDEDENENKTGRSERNNTILLASWRNKRLSQEVNTHFFFFFFLCMYSFFVSFQFHPDSLLFNSHLH